ncbi:hypothetical protein CMI37_26695 [Candidatus Pacearchaeota archaeon]|nr:hypothetical protein [Candidatus Pacearchaeota archaeon]|tara:strand:- start:1189 stop:1383 length:195 start_codon:yes stop_codon:yes gene_type:complete
MTLGRTGRILLVRPKDIPERDGANSVESVIAHAADAMNERNCYLTDIRMHNGVVAYVGEEKNES